MKFIRISSLWCTSCIVTYSTWNDLKKIYKEAEFIEYDYDTDEEVKKYDIGNILPVMIVEKDGRELTRIIGEKSKKEILKVLEELGD